MVKFKNKLKESVLDEKYENFLTQAFTVFPGNK